MERRKVILLILDGWGYREECEHNAVCKSEPAVFNRLWSSSPRRTLLACGEAVGLPEGQMGNSEVGHTNIGAGRVVYQDFLKISKDAASGKIATIENIVAFNKQLAASGGRLHLMGLISDGGVHSHINHVKAVAKAAHDAGVKEVFVHAYTDGRDTPPNSGAGFVSDLDGYLRSEGVGAVVTVCGRYYAMDRDKRWDRVERAYRMLTEGTGERAASAADAVTVAYGRGETDEFIQPTVVDGFESRILDGDGVFFINFRADRAREMTHALVDEVFTGFPREKRLDISFLTMTEYESTFDIPAAYPPETLSGILGEVVSAAGLKQLRIAETEKYAHVTYFLNGGREDVFAGEERKLIPSPRDVATYDMKPEMSVYEVTAAFEELFAKGDLDLVVMNFANPDMVGHTGDENAAIRACKAVDECLGRVVAMADAMNAVLLVTADHGNSDQMWDYDTNQPHTAHSLNPVPFVVYNYPCTLRDGEGKLADIAPTILRIMGLETPSTMTGEPLIV